MIRKLNTISLLAVAAFFLAGLIADGKIIYVDDDAPADFNNIQAAVDDANDSDKIIVQPGLYREFVYFHGKNITLTSTNPGDFDVVAATVIDRGVAFAGTEDPNCMLSGFKINGWISGVDYGIDPAGENHTHATISHCLLVSCLYVSDGSVIRNCDGTIRNCVIADNRHTGDVIRWVISKCHGLIRNCTVANNSSMIGIEKDGTTTIENCIIYNNSNNSVQVGLKSGATLNIRHTNIQGGLDKILVWKQEGTVNWGPGNIDADPCFARVGDWWLELNGDYHLKSQAGIWTSASSVEPDADEGRWTKDDVTSPCIDAGDPSSPIGFEPFPNGGIINMGAYGGTAEASKSYFGGPVCETIVAGDINGDCKIDFNDFVLMAAHWLEDNSQ